MPRRDPFLSTLAKALAALGMLLAIAAAGLPLRAQDAAARREPPAQAAAQRPLGPLPEVRRTRHTLALPDRTLRFTAAAGSIAFSAPDNAVLADLAYTHYVLDDADPATRPVVFAFNGGPGSASTWLHLGTLGPWRVPLTSETISGKSPPLLVDNAETWLDFADLVLLDPPGTGFSRIWPHRGPVMPGMRREGAPPEGRPEPALSAQPVPSRMTGGMEWFWSVDGDIATFVEAITGWLDRHGRKSSPVVIAGESYGGFRAPLIAEALAKQAVHVRALLLISPVLDFDGRRGWRTPQHYVALLPSIAATRIERTGETPSRTLLAEAEGYARGDYLLDLQRGVRDRAALRRMSERVGPLAGLAPETVLQQSARLTIRSFVEASPLLHGAVSIYDAGMTGLQPIRSSGRGGFADPFTEGLDPPLTTAMAALHNRIDWQPERPYVMLAGEVNRRWVWPNSPHPPQVLGTLHSLHRKDPRLHTLIVHGFTDLVTPYFASALQLDQIPSHGAEQRIALEVYPGGHMFYSRDASRARFRDDAERLIGKALKPAVTKTNDATRGTW